VEPRPYRSADREACLAVFDSNAPAGGREEFERFLEEGLDCTVLEHEGSIVGCGGFVIEGETARLVHGMIRRDMQRLGLGRFLLMYRLRQIAKAASPVKFVRVTVDAKWARFYEKQGFKPGPGGGDLMMKLTVCP
jgi:GNAT superfamily N-acetyltransferase